MHNRETWQPTKFCKVDGRWVGSRNPEFLSVGSRFIGDILAPVYDQAIQHHVRGRLLDLGCGHVPLYGMYRNLISDSVCVDWPQSMHKLYHVDHFVDLNGSLPFAEHEFDTVLLTDVIEHIARPENLWSEIARVLRPEGKLVLTVPFLYWIHEKPHDYHRFSEYSLRLCCENNRLEIISLEPYGGVLEVICDLICKNLNGRPWITSTFIAFAKRMLRFKGVRNFSLSSCRDFPLGYCLIAYKRSADSAVFTGSRASVAADTRLLAGSTQ